MNCKILCIFFALVLVCGFVLADSSIVRENGKVKMHAHKVPDFNSDVVITPETVEPSRLTAQGFEYWHEVQITNYNNKQIELGEDNFGGEGIDYKLYTWHNVDYVEPDLNCWTEPDCVGVGAEEVCMDITVCDFYKDVNGMTLWDQNHEVTTQVLGEFKNKEKINKGETRSFYYRYYSWAPSGKWDFYFYYDGNTYLIDPYWTNSTSLDLNHDYDYNGYVWQIREGNNMGAWTPTNEIDWNIEADYSIGGTAWDQNLILYYKFDDLNSDGSGVVDMTGNYDGALLGGTTITSPGMWDSNALNLDGINDYIDVVGYNGISGNNPASVMYWIRTSKLDTSHFQWGNDAAAGGTFVGKTEATTGYLGFRMAGASYNLISSYKINDSKWHHVALVYDPTVGQTAYVDGAIVASNSSTGANMQSLQTMKIAAYRTGTSYFMDGSIDEFQLYDKALNQNEIIADYNRFLSAKFVDANIYGNGVFSDWNYIKVNSDLNYDFNKEICADQDPCDNDVFGGGMNQLGIWHMNGNMNDSYTGLPPDGFYGAQPVYTTGLWGTDAGSFNSTGAWYYNAAPLSPLDETFTINFWFKGDSTFVDGIVTNHYSSSFNSNHSIWTLVSGKFRYQDSPNAGVDTVGTYEDSEWHMVTFVHTEDLMTIYVDGRFDNAGNPGNPVNRTVHLTIGGNNDAIYKYWLDGAVEDLGIWDYVMSENEVRDLYRKGVASLDLNVIACSDASCSTETGSTYLTDVNNNTWYDLSALGNSTYIRWEGIFKQNTDFVGKPAGFYRNGAIITDVNIDYDELVTDINFHVYPTGSSVDLNNIDVDCNVDTYDAVDQNSPFLITFEYGSYSCEFSTARYYDSNTITFIANTGSADINVYLDPKPFDVNFIYPTNGSLAINNTAEFYLVAVPDGNITDGNYSINGATGTLGGFGTSCQNWDTNLVHCTLIATGYSQLMPNDLNVCFDTNLSESYCEGITFNYNPSATGLIVLPGEDDLVPLLFLIVVIICAVLAYFVFGRPPAR